MQVVPTKRYTMFLQSRCGFECDDDRRGKGRISLASCSFLLGTVLFAIGDANARDDVLLLKYARRQRTGYLQRNI